MMYHNCCETWTKLYYKEESKTLQTAEQYAIKHALLCNIKLFSQAVRLLKMSDGELTNYSQEIHRSVKSQTGHFVSPCGYK